jgi:Na+/melibiose symporter-like transporter
MLIGELAVLWVIFFYAPPEGTVFAPALLVGGVVFFGRIVDAIADPLVGYFSDKSKSRLGNAIIADVIDHDETITGFRREAIYFRKYPFQKQVITDGGC